MTSRQVMALDVGGARIGVALAQPVIGIAVAYDTIEVNGDECTEIAKLAEREQVEKVIVGYPRNQSGEPTKQTAAVEAFVERLTPLVPEIEYQDESLTSVKAEEILKRQKKPYTKGDIDALAASLILQDYLEAQHGRV